MLALIFFFFFIFSITTLRDVEHGQGTVLCVYLHFPFIKNIGGQITKDDVEMLFDRIQSFQCKTVCCSKYVVESSQDDIMFN